MKKYDYLTDYVMKNIWCSPRQDFSQVIQPKRITHRYGEWKHINTGWRVINLPHPDARFHVFQYGQIFPLLLGLVNSREKWTLISDVCNSERMLVDVYTKDGFMLPRYKAWYMVTRDNNLVMAVEECERINDLISYGDEAIYFRFYSNAYFRSERSFNQPQEIRIKGYRPSSVSEIVALQDEVQIYRSRPGAVFTFVNGRFKDNIDPINASVGDYLEYVYDSSVKRVVTFNLAQLKEFESSLDSRRKYLLNYPKITDNPIIDYRDDVDIYIYKPNGNKLDGVYWNHNSSDWLRNLTHQDYSIPVQLVHVYINSNPGWTSPDQVRIRLYIRNSGFERPLVYENNRIHELYRLSNEKIPRAMLGIDATVQNWQAANLENSWYVKVMGLDANDLDRDIMEQTLGYNAISRLLGDTPNPITDQQGTMVANVPYGLQVRSTGFEYDENGILLDYHAHVNTSLWPQRDFRASMVEIVAGYSDIILDEYYAEPTVELDPNYQFRCYICPLVSGVPNNEWEDVTGSSLYSVSGNTLTWLVDPLSTYTLVRTNKQNLTYKQTITPFSGNVRFVIRQQSYRNNVLVTHNMQIPMGELDIWCNGHSLIEGVDFIVKFPEVIIISKEWLKSPFDGPQDIVVRFTGFCDNNLNYNTRSDKGFVNHGVLSHNNRYDVRDDKVVRIVIGGSTYDRNIVQFAEDHGGTLVPDELNGLPYCIRDVFVPTRGMTDKDPFQMKQESLVIDERVGNYLTIHYPLPHYGNPNVAQQRYRLVSPFINAISHDLTTGILNDPRIYQEYNDMVAKDIVSSYQYLLPFDPTQPENEIDSAFVVCVPHVFDHIVELDIFQYKFLERIVRLYSRGLIQLSHYYKLSEI